MAEVAGRRRASKHSQPRSRFGPLPRALAAMIGAAVASVAWIFLVGAAIEFGNAGRGGQTTAWFFALAASFGAVVCLVLVLVLIMRALTALGVIGDHNASQGAGGRRRK